VDISFADADLAALCNSKRRMTARWGVEGFSLVSRRLCELAAVDGSEVAHLPLAAIASDDDGSVAIDFDRGGLTVVAVPLEGNEPIHDIRRADGVRIVNLSVGGVT
jgi:hypothetical protein